MFIPQKNIHFLKNPQKIEIQKFDPKKMDRAYVCMKISEYPPPPPPWALGYPVLIISTVISSNGMCYEITISLISSLILYHCHKVKHIFYMIPIFTVMKNNLSFGFYSTCTLVFWLPTLDLFDKFHSLLSLNWKLTRHSPVQE